MRSIALSFLLASACLIGPISCDGNHAHAHGASVTSTDDASAPASVPSAPTATGSATSVHSSSSDGAGTNDAFASILQTVSQNPQLAAAARAAGYNIPAAGKYDLPPPPGGVPPGPGAGRPGFPGGFPGGLGGFGLPFGFGKGFNLNVNAGAGVGGYYPIIEKAIVIIGGGILILLIIAFIQGSLAAGGFLSNLFGSFSKAMAGSVNVDVGPLHKTVSGASALSINDRIGVGGASPNDPQFNQRVNQGLDRRF